MASQPSHPDIAAVDPVNLLRATADPVRLQLIKILNDGKEYSCSDLADCLGIPLPTMSHHLKTMREAGLIHNRKAGTTRWTSLRKEELDEHFPGFTDQLVSMARPR